MIDKIKILLAEHYPYSITDIDKIYNFVRSIDKTIIILEMAMRYNLNIFYLAEDMMLKNN